jgi:hypothetical protein
MTDEDGNYIVNNKTSQYWKKLHGLFDSSIKHKKLKTKTELVDFIKRLIKVINDNDLLNVSTEIQTFYQSMFKKEKFDMLKKIILKGVSGFEKLINFSGQEIRNYLNNKGFIEILKDVIERDKITKEAAIVLQLPILNNIARKLNVKIVPVKNNDEAVKLALIFLQIL